MNVDEQWQGLVGRYRALTLRERALVVATLLAVTWAAWDATLGQALAASRAEARGRIDALERQIAGVRAERRQIETSGVGDPNERLRRERDRLDGKLRDMDASLGTLLDRFVAPESMPALLEDVIHQHQGLKLIRIDSLSAELMEVSAPQEQIVAGEASATPSPPAPVRIYRHPLRLQFEGSYFDVLAYLAQIESGDWRFGWRHLDYEVRDYPVARVTVEIETLSRERSWIGV